MQFIIDREIFGQHRDLKIGAIVIRGFDNTRRISPIESLLRGACAQRGKEFKDKDIHEERMIQVWDQAYGRFGINPRKYQPSIAALLKRVQSGKEIPHINPIVDLYNYFSLKYLLPIGGEDLDWLCGDLHLAFTVGGEPFRPLGSIEVEHAKEGEVAYKDSAGITCRYWNHRECERSKFTGRTTNAVILIEDLSKMHMDEFGRILNEMEETINKYIGSQTELYILNEESSSLDFGIQGRSNLDDAKIPQQEKAHFLESQKVKKLEKAGKVEPETPVEKPAEILPKTQINSVPSQTPKKKLWSSLLYSKPLKLEDKKQLRERLKALFVKSVRKFNPKIKAEIHLAHTDTSEHGDYACSLALQLAKSLQKPPREIAQNIIDNLPANKLIEKTEIAGPGFINIFVSQPFLQKEIGVVLKNKDHYGFSTAGKNKTLIFEYSSPNIAKPLGVHHLLSTVIGQSLRNIFQNRGFNAISINHIGDWGTQFGKLIYAYKNWGDKKIIERNPIGELLKLYVKFHKEAEQKPILEDHARGEFKKFEESDSENRKLWKWFVAESMEEINGTYEKLGGTNFDFVQGESFYEDKMRPILEEGKKKGIFVEGEEGAYVAKFDDPNIPTVPVQKKDGATLYITRDFATLKYRLDTWHPAKIIYVVDVAQTLHFKQIFAVAAKFPWYGGEGEHVVFGRMQFKDAQMSTRKGNIISLDEVLDEAVKRAGKIVQEKNPDLAGKDEVARVVGVGAVKYNILSQNRTTDITFDWDKILSLEGNSAPYLQYTYARARSIAKKASANEVSTLPAIPQNHATTVQTSPKSDISIAAKTRALIALFPKFSEQISVAAAEYKPNVVANYLYELAQKFNAFYNSVPVLKAASANDRKARLKIVEATAQIIKNGLALLGVEVVEEM